MAIVYLDCDTTYSDLEHVCNPCVDPELGNIRSIALIKPGTSIDIPLNEIQWNTQILAGNMKIVPNTRGNWDGGTPKMGTGYGDVKERKLGSEHVLMFKDPDFADNSGDGGFWADAEKQDWNLAFRTETLLHYVDAKVTITEKAPVQEDLESEVVSEVECKWISQKKPVITAVAPVLNIFKCFEVNKIHLTGVSVPANLDFDINIAASTNFATNVVFTPSNATNKAMLYSSSNPNAGVIDSYGTITFIGAGVTIITATSVDGGFTDTCVVDIAS